MKLLWFLFSAFLIPHILFATDYLRSGDVRGLALGGNGVAGSAMFNPAFVVREGRGVRLSYYNMYSMKELGVAGGCFFLQHSALSGGIHIASFGYDAWRETMFRLPVGKRLSERLALGVSVQYAVLQTELYEEQPARLAVDAGMVWEAVDRLTLGLLLMNYPSVIISADDSMRQAGFMPPRIQAGAQWQAGSDVVLAATIDWAEFRKVGLHAGIAYKAFERFEFRSGIKLPSLLPSFGVGYEWRPLVVDIAAAYHPVLGFGRGIGISYMF